jgi:hypothetical protein
MKFPILLVFVLVVSIVNAEERYADRGLPDDVIKYLQRRNICEHWRGEEPYDEERRKYIDEAWNSSCPGSDKGLALLKEKYKNNQVVLKTLKNYEDKIE